MVSLCERERKSVVVCASLWVCSRERGTSGRNCARNAKATSHQLNTEIAQHYHAQYRHAAAMARESQALEFGYECLGGSSQVQVFRFQTSSLGPRFQGLGCSTVVTSARRNDTLSACSPPRSEFEFPYPNCLTCTVACDAFDFGKLLPCRAN